VFVGAYVVKIGFGLLFVKARAGPIFTGIYACIRIFANDHDTGHLTYVQKYALQ
jgi:hypothetical protein